ncbi:cell wall protein RBR3-like [Lytechinus variegatus]|uniref:cell wall protein RBR3-like n=1 Tax=Lytechinus variegatus TaxID=7654 RepID=UPI001BB23691|nr:cell wall protein RBR3-like [Lytechinus variegatus]
MAHLVWRKHAAIFVFGIIILHRSSGVYSVCQKPQEDQYASTIFIPDFIEYEEFTTVEMTCEPGTSGAGSPTSLCMKGVWEPSPLICYSNCERPGVYHDVTYDPDQESYEHDSVVTYECVDGTNDLLGPNQACCENGVWNPLPTSANPSCSGIRTVPPTTSRQTTDTTSRSATSGPVSTVATSQDGTTDVTTTAIEETEPVSGRPSSTENPSTAEPVTPTYVAPISDSLTSMLSLTTYVSEFKPSTEPMTTISVQTTEDTPGSPTLELTEGSTVLIHETDSITVSESTSLMTPVSAFSATTDRSERITTNDFLDRTDSSSVVGVTASRAVTVTNPIEGTTALVLTEQTGMSTVSDALNEPTKDNIVSSATFQTEGITMITSIGTADLNTDITSEVTITTEGIQTTGYTSGTQTDGTHTQGTDQQTGQTFASTVKILPTDSISTSASAYPDETHIPTTGTLGSEQTKTEQHITMSTGTLVTSSTISDLTSQATNTYKITSEGHTDVSTIPTEELSTTDISSSETSVTTMQAMTSKLGTAISSDPVSTSSSEGTFITMVTEDILTTNQPEGTKTPIEDMSTAMIGTVSTGVSDEVSQEPNEGPTTSIDVTEDATTGDITIITTNAVTEPSKTSTGQMPTEAKVTTMKTTSPVEDPCNGQCDVDREICVDTTCICREGSQRPYGESTCEPTTYYTISMTILEIDGAAAIFTSELQSTGSDAFNTLQLTVCTAVTALLDGIVSGFKSCSAISFSVGSIIAEIRLGFTNTTGVETQSILDAVMTANPFQVTNSNFTINPNETSVTPTDECELGLDDCSHHADCKDLAEKSFTCQCWDGYADNSPEGYDGRNCAAYNWKLITIVVGSCTGALLLAACVILVCGNNIVDRCSRRPTNVTSGRRRPGPKQDVGVTTDDTQDIIPWHHREKDEEIFYAHPVVDGQEARRLNSARNLRGKESYINDIESYDLNDYRSSTYDHDDRYVPLAM